MEKDEKKTTTADKQTNKQTKKAITNKQKSMQENTRKGEKKQNK